MTKKDDREITCPNCKRAFNAILYSSIHVDEQKERELLFNDDVNRVRCPHCQAGTWISTTLLCVNHKLKFAIWYDPNHDKQLDDTTEYFKKTLGPNTFFLSAPRISDWNDLKSKIIEFEKKTRVDTERDSENNKPNKDALIAIKSAIIDSLQNLNATKEERNADEMKLAKINAALSEFQDTKYCRHKKFIRLSILLARRFEKWVVGLFALAALFASVTQAIERNYWDAGILFLVFVLSGIIGQGFSQYRKRSAPESIGNFSPAPKDAGEIELSDEELDNLVTIEKRLGVLWTFAIVAICVHNDVIWWKIASSVIAIWVLLFAISILLGIASKVRVSHY